MPDGSPEQMLRDFHAEAGLILPARPTLDLSSDRFTSDESRQELLDSEVQELRDAVAARDLVGIADALADIVYAAVGTAVTYGLPFDAIMTEVHRSNMTKMIGGAVIRPDGKIVKGPHYEPPDLAPLLAPDSDLLAPGTVLTSASGAEYVIGEPIGYTAEPGMVCDAAEYGGHPSMDGTGRCRCVVCARCGHHTGNSHQGHYWGFCHVTRTVREPHLCCPTEPGCELEDRATT